MVERNNELIVVDWKKDLKEEAKVQYLAVTNYCLESLKQTTADYLKFATLKIFDHLIDEINSRKSV